MVEGESSGRGWWQVAEWAGLVALAWLVALLLSGCQRMDSPGALVAAQRQMQAGQVDEALITLKDALQRDGENTALQAMLGRALLASGDVQAAEPLLRRAVRAGSEEAVPALVQAQRVLGQAEAALREQGARSLREPALAAELKQELALAELALGRANEAQARLVELLKAQPGHVQAQLLLARLHMARGETAQAQALMKAALAAEPPSADAWQAQGDLLATSNENLAGAAEAYRKALALQPQHARARAGLIQLAVLQGRLDEAAEQLKSLQRDAPHLDATQRAGALLLLEQGRWLEAKQVADRLIKAGGEEPGALMLAARAELGLGARWSAAARLQRVLALDAQAVGARLLLAQTQAGSGDYAKVLATLAPLLQPAGEGKAAPDEAVLLAADAHLRLDQDNEALALLDRGLQANPASKAMRAARALAQIRQGDEARGLAQLEAQAAQDPAGPAVPALAAERAARGEWPAAMALAQRAAQAEPARGQWTMLQAGFFAAQGRTAEARQGYEEALKREPGLLPATLALAELDLNQMHFSAGLERLKAALDARPADTALLRVVALARQRAGRPLAEVVPLLEQAIQRQPGDADLVLAKAQVLLAAGDAPAALAVVQAAQAAFPGNPAVQLALGLAQLQAGEAAPAVRTLRQQWLNQPHNRDLAVLLARAQVDAQDTEGARTTLRQALAEVPWHVGVRNALAMLEAQARNVPAALELARQWQQARPAAPEGWLLEARVFAHERRHETSIAPLREALKRGDGADAAMRLHAAFVALRQPEKADQVAADWLQRHPGHLGMLMQRADGAAAQGLNGPAVAHYRAVVEVAPEHAMALNNLAHLLVQAGDPTATGFAERALQLQPDRAVVMDTLAQALALEGRHADALALQQRAVQAAPRLDPLRLTLARVAHEAGDNELARRELKRLLESGHDFKGRDAAALLYRQVQ